MKALVTGANGFLGTHLLQLLQSKNVEIHALGTRPTPIGTFHDVAYNNRPGLESLIQEIHPDAIFHLAGVSTAADFRFFYDINIAFASNIICALKKSGNNKCPVILTGTSAEYGVIQASDLPIRESTPTRPYSHYGISKLAQTLMGQVEALTGWPFIMVRPFNIIGPAMPKHLVLQSIVEQLKNIRLHNAPPVLEVGDMSAQRDFVNVSDTAESMWRLINEPRAYGEIVNICSGVSLSINSILERLFEITNIKVDVRVHPDRLKAIDIPVHFGSNAKQKNLTGYSPTTEIDATLRQILAYEKFLEN